MLLKLNFLMLKKMNSGKHCVILYRSYLQQSFFSIEGNLNGHVGKARYGYVQSHGDQGFGIRNNDGYRILYSTEAHDMVVVNTLLGKRPSHLITYTSEEQATEIDY